MATTVSELTTISPPKASATTALPAKVSAVEAPTTPTAQAVPKVIVKKVGGRSAPIQSTISRKATTTSPKKPATPVVKAVAKTVTKAALKPKAAKPEKERKAKLVRDSFTIPKDEYGFLNELKHRAGKLAMPIKKSELLRAGIKALTAMPDSAFLKALKAVPTIKTGRPAKG